jgi:formamidopyrimidine-DNA glycosylase
MPELPEVEVTRLGLLPHLLQRKVTGIRWSNKRLRRPMPRKLLRDSIRGKTITTIDRRAKYLLIRMQDNSVLAIHLGMTGKLGMFATAAPTARHDHLRLCLDNGMEVRFNDVRRFGSITVWPGHEALRLEEAFNRTKGIEPFSPEFTAGNLERLARRRTIAVKKFLMDAGIIAGIGNIYANEILFAAGIHPRTGVAILSEEQWHNITKSGREILSRAIAAGGSTISDFLGASGKPGYFQLQLGVYGKKDKPCPVCGSKIKKEILAGRATFFCSHCQPL